MNIYEKFGIQPVINASGTVTRLGGARMSPAVTQALVEAADYSVSLEELHGVASRRITSFTGSEAALVTSGASAGLLLGAAAMLAGLDLVRMDRLPDTTGIPNEFIVARSHRNGYDHAIRAAGGRFVEVGMDELHSGAGVRLAEAWEYQGAIGSNTVGILYTLTDSSIPPLEEIVELAHANNLPVLVDAAAQLPPVSNLNGIIETGADLVTFSGGKAIGGPQSTGILCGCRPLVGSAFLQMMDNDEHYALWDPPAEFISKSELPGIPRHGIGRPLKVAKEEIVALLVALDEFMNLDSNDKIKYERWLEQIRDSLSAASVKTRIINRPTPILEIRLQTCGKSAVEVCRRLRDGTPPIYVGHALLRAGKIIVNPSCLSETDVTILADRLTAELQ